MKELRKNSGLLPGAKGPVDQKSLTPGGQGGVTSLVEVAGLDDLARGVTNLGGVVDLVELLELVELTELLTLLSERRLLFFPGGLAVGASNFRLVPEAVRSRFNSGADRYWWSSLRRTCRAWKAKDTCIDTHGHIW